DSELGEVGFAAEDGDDFLVLVGRQVVLRYDLWRHWRCSGHLAASAPECAAMIDWNTPRPSHEPMIFSTARSGWGIMPMTLRPALRMPAMRRTEPLALSIYL